jgi:putative aldouronate transport system permease protein
MTLLKKKKKAYVLPQDSSLSFKDNRIVSLFYAFLALLVFLPVLLVIMAAFSSENSVTMYGYRFIPHEFSVESFRYMFRAGSTLPRSFLNSVIITAAGTLLSLIIMAPCAYAMSREEFRGRTALMIYLMIPMIFSGGLVSTYMVNTQVLHLKNTYLALILPGLCSTWYLMVLRNYFKITVPGSLIDSARIDGAMPMQIFVRIVLPLCRPVIMTVAIFQIFAYWNSWYPSLLYIDTNHTQLYPLQYVLVNIDRSIQAMILDAQYTSGMSGYDPPAVTIRMAMVVIAIAPIIILFPFFQKFLKTGLTVGSVKG